MPSIPHGLDHVKVSSPHTCSEFGADTESIMNSAFETLRASLRRALANARFDLGRVERPGKTSYANRQGEVVGPDQLREMLTGSAPDNANVKQAQAARVCMSDWLESDLKSSFRHALERHYDRNSDRVGYAFSMGAGDSYPATWPSGICTEAEVSSVEQFSATMTKLAAVLGVDAVVDLLAAWTRGEPIAYRTCVVIGLTLDKPIEPTRGIRVTPLPLTTAELPSGLPTMTEQRRSAYLGHSILSVDTLATPALFRPVSDNRSPVRGKLPNNFDVDLICQALSLECDVCVGTGVGWNDYSDLSPLIGGRSAWGIGEGLGRPAGWLSSTSSEELTTIQPLDGSVQNPSEDAIKHLLKQLKGADDRTRVAVDRWKKSRLRGATLTNRFIDLRIALESLFLPQTPDQQLRFRLATNGAWLVGRDYADRRKAWHILGDAYNEASKAVHHGKVKPNDDTEKLLANAQVICRRGIRHVLRDGPVSDWNGLILGASCEKPA